jgi:hypothetical protein
MSNTYIADIQLNEKSHVEFATDIILAQLLTAKDDRDIQILKTAERMAYNSASVNKPDGPYAILRIIDDEPILVSQEFEVHQSEAELLIDIVFSANASDDVQALGSRLRQRLWKVLQNYEVANLIGLDLDPNGTGRCWNFSTDTRFKAQIRRTVVALDETSQPLSGSRYTIPLLFKIITYPSIPLT